MYTQCALTLCIVFTYYISRCATLPDGISEEILQVRAHDNTMKLTVHLHIIFIFK